MDMSIPVFIKSYDNFFLAKTSWPARIGANLHAYGIGKDEALFNMCMSLFAHIEEYGRAYINSQAASNEFINCSNGLVDLPIDLWLCKHTKEPCPLQASINMGDKDSFFRRCTASDKEKKGIWAAIENEKYDGFHHMPGRYKCVACDKKNIYRNYHYPWELVLLGDCCNVDSIDIKKLILEDVNTSVTYGALCGECLTKLAKQFPEMKLPDCEIITYPYIHDLPLNCDF